ncbi:hypothetical protein HPX47_004810 [Vibrio alginolyticus]|nr:hypothetical protein [Vibrio alginolyticus]
MDLKNFQQRLEQINKMRTQAANDPEFQELAKEHESSIKNEVKKEEELSRTHGKRGPRKLKSRKSKSVSIRGSLGTDKAIID